MPTITFGEWTPDQPDLRNPRNPGALTATNVYPAANGYRPVPEFSTISNSALDARPRGAIQARDKDLNVFQYVGDAAKLYQNVSGVWTDRSISGGYSSGTEAAWEFVRWQNKVLATNFADNPQQITLGDSAFSDLTSSFKARHIAVIRDHVVFANTTDVSDGAVPGRVRWSAFNDETDYVTSLSTLAGSQDLKLAPVERVFGGEFGVVMQQDSIWRMSWVGSGPVFQFDEVLPEIGPIAPGAACQVGSRCYLFSNQGLLELVNGVEVTPLGAEKFDRTILDDIDEDYLERISMAVDPRSKRIFMAYPGAGNTDGRPNKLLVYDRVLQKAALIAEEVELVWSAGSTGFTLDDLDSISGSLDGLTQSLDSRRYVGGARTLGIFDENFQLGFFDGSSNKSATIETGEIEIHSGHMTALTALSPLIDGGDVTARIGTRNRQSDDVTYTAALTQSTSGRFTKRAKARFHRFEFSPTGAWTDAVGLHIAPEDAKRAERRG